MVDPKTTNVQQHFSLMLTAAEVCAVTAEGSKNPIFELECLAMLAGVKVWANHLRHKHVILFTDNNLWEPRFRVSAETLQVPT